MALQKESWRKRLRPLAVEIDAMAEWQRQTFLKLAGLPTVTSGDSTQTAALLERSNVQPLSRPDSNRS
jgi:hypothetical protein